MAEAVQTQTEQSPRDIKIKLVRSLIGNSARQRATVHSLGLRKMHQVVVQRDTPTTRGMIDKVRHLVQIVED